MNELEKINAIGFWLVNQCIKQNAEKLVYTQKSVTHLGENLGDWEIIVKKVTKKRK